ncbi:5-oxoprolinase subunit PxpA [Fluviispira vulneris]|uniref:5-oxoprolinase subunit PxpA n=1 Tax=Fluviispira vulneris TaxID=2763012 RepID=UPI001644B360|nr:5-oxoprolinase subunit PxpA [Fluviispira vulneris]
MKIDLNADIGEGFKNDKEIINYVSSVNIACARHAGTPISIHQSVKWAMARGISLGAHPGYPDEKNFGRVELNLSAEVLFAEIIFQISALQGIVNAEKGKLTHVKLHGALYNQAAHDLQIADIIISAIKKVNPKLKLFALAGSPLVQKAKKEHLAIIEEGFADRCYKDDGTLLARSECGAIIKDKKIALKQSLTMIKEKKVISQNGKIFPIKIDTICLHGDNPHALNLTKYLFTKLINEGIAIQTYK